MSTPRVVPVEASAKDRQRARLRLAAMVLGIVALLSLPGLLWLRVASAFRARHDAALKTVPPFPARDAPNRWRESRPAAPQPRQPEAPAPAPTPGAPTAGSQFRSFALAPAQSVGVIQVNALMHTPLYDRLRRCMPKEFGEFAQKGKEFGVDLEKDVDRIAITPGGFALSGFFDSDALAQKVLATGDGGKTPLSSSSYRGQTIWTNGGFCAVPMRSLVLMGPRNCEGLVDRALSPPPAAGEGDELNGDMYVRTDLRPLREGLAAAGTGASPTGFEGGLGEIVRKLDQVTVRANVWESVALSLEAQPAPGQDPRRLAEIARMAMDAGKSQLDPDAAELQALSELARVDDKGGNLEMQAAIPKENLLEWMHFPCPAEDAPVKTAGAPAR